MHFNAGWVPYAERGAWLAEADVGVSAHLDHLEARFAFRTRILDYLWAGLPVVVTRGDALGELVERERLGRAVAEPGDVDGFAAACARLLGAGRRRGAASGSPRSPVAALERGRARRWSHGASARASSAPAPTHRRDRCAARRWRSTAAALPETLRRARGCRRRARGAASARPPATVAVRLR